MNTLYLLNYIDPGTGSMLFTVIIGIATTLFFVLRGVLIKFKFAFRGGKAREDQNKHDVVIFSDSKRYWNVFGPICSELEQRKIRCEYWTASADDPALQESYQYVTCKFIGEGNKTWLNIKASKAFTVALADEAHMDAADFFGIASGNKINDKFERTGYHAVKSDKVHAPIVEEFPLVMECELLEFLHSDYVDGIVGKIVNVKAEESVLSEKGKVDPQKLHALIFDQFQHGYYVTGEQVGKAWNAGVGLMKK